MSDEHLRAAEAILAGRGSARILASMSPQQPDSLMRAILTVARRRDVRLTMMFADLAGSFAFLDETAEHEIARGRLRLVSMAGAIHRRWSHLTDYLPYSLWDIDRMLASGDLPVDIVIARVLDGEAPHSARFGEMVGYTASALATKARAVFEIVSGTGPTGLRTTPSFKLDRADVIVRSEQPPRPIEAAAQLTAEQREIGRLVRTLVPDGATLQLGLGAVAEAVVSSLTRKTSLGIHSGILTPSLNTLIKSGVITGQAKSRDVGIAVATGIFGSSGNSADDWGGQAELRPISETHDPRLLLTQQSLWAVNSALEVDLTGQVNAEYVDGVRIASGGGQSDFVRAAHFSEGGASVIALPSRTQRGRSRIIPRINCPATSAGQDIDFVVTEHGIAALRGLSAGEKAKAIIAVAHPDDRRELNDRPHLTKSELRAI